jgi:hypothetical protein
VLGLRVFTRMFTAALLCAAVGAGVAQAATTRYVATAAHGGNDNGGANTCLASATPCLTISHAVSEAASGNTIAIGPGRFPEAISAASKTLTFIGAGAGTSTSFDPSTQTFVDASATSDPGITTGSHATTIEKLRIEGGIGSGATIEPAIDAPGAASTPALSVSGSVLLQSSSNQSQGKLPALDADATATNGVNVTVSHSLVDAFLAGISIRGTSSSLRLTNATVLAPTPTAQALLPPVAVSAAAQATIVDSELVGEIGLEATGKSTIVLRSTIKASDVGILFNDEVDGPTLAVRDSVVTPAAGVLPRGIAIDQPGSGQIESPTLYLTFDSVLARASGTAHALDVAVAATGTHVNSYNTILRAIDTSGGSGNDDIASGSQAINWNINYTDYTQTFGVGVPQPSTGTNFDVQPHFVNDDGTNLRLSSSSTLFDKGDSSIVNTGETDVTGAPRALAHTCGGAPLPDIGAYEAPAPGSCPPPTVTLTTPANGASYTQGQSVTAAYTCGAPPAPATLSACTGPVPSGQTLDTSTLGTQTFTVTATSNDGSTATATATYTIKPAPAPKPSLGAIKVSHKTFRTGNKLASVAKAKHAKKPPVGTTFSFKLNTSATLKLAFAKVTPGRKVGHKCVAPTKHNAHARSCKRSKSAGSITLSGHAGTDKVNFQGRLSKHKKLKPGTYTLTITATNTTGKSRSRTAKFTVTT